MLNNIDNNTTLSKEELDACRELLLVDPFSIRHFHFQPEELKIFAASVDGMVLKYIDNPSEEVCLAALYSQGSAPYDVFQLIENKTPLLCDVAVGLDPFTLEWIESQTEDLCIKAVSKNGKSLSSVKKQTEAIAIAAVYFYFFKLIKWY